jgi:hypothetical protein
MQQEETPMQPTIWFLNKVTGKVFEVDAGSDLAKRLAGDEKEYRQLSGDEEENLREIAAANHKGEGPTPGDWTAVTAELERVQGIAAERAAENERLKAELAEAKKPSTKAGAAKPQE